MRRCKVWLKSFLNRALSRIVEIATFLRLENITIRRPRGYRGAMSATVTVDASMLPRLRCLELLSW